MVLTTAPQSGASNLLNGVSTNPYGPALSIQQNHSNAVREIVRPRVKNKEVPILDTLVELTAWRIITHKCCACLSLFAAKFFLGGHRVQRRPNKLPCYWRKCHTKARAKYQPDPFAQRPSAQGIGHLRGSRHCS
jgi:hypothetical protein